MVVGEALLTIKSTDSASSAGREAQLNHSGCNCYLPLNCQHPPPPHSFRVPTVRTKQVTNINFVGVLNGPGTLISVLNMSQNTYSVVGKPRTCISVLNKTRNTFQWAS